MHTRLQNFYYKSHDQIHRKSSAHTEYQEEEEEEEEEEQQQQQEQVEEDI